MTDYFDADGAPVDEDDLEVGDIVYDADGAEYEMKAAEQEQEKELVDAGVAKSAFGASSENTEASKTLTELRAELAKALTEDDRASVLSKAIEQVEALEKRATVAEKIAKGERDLRLEREYISKAAEYNVPIEPEKLGPVLMRMADTMSYEDCAVIHKALTTSGQMLFAEIGYEGNGDNADPFKQVEAYLEEQVSKSADTKVSKAQAVADYYTTNPAAYDEYVAGLGR